MVAEVVHMKAGHRMALVTLDMGLLVVQAVGVRVVSTAVEACCMAEVLVGTRSGQDSHQAPVTACFVAFLAGAVPGTWTAEVARQGMAAAMEAHQRHQRQVSRQEAWCTSSADPAAR